MIDRIESAGHDAEHAAEPSAPADRDIAPKRETRPDPGASRADDMIAFLRSRDRENDRPGSATRR